jgi:hypothetical protein
MGHSVKSVKSFSANRAVSTRAENGVPNEQPGDNAVHPPGMAARSRHEWPPSVMELIQQQRRFSPARPSGWMTVPICVPSALHFASAGARCRLPSSTIIRQPARHVVLR